MGVHVGGVGVCGGSWGGGVGVVWGRCRGGGGVGVVRGWGWCGGGAGRVSASSTIRPRPTGRGRPSRVRTWTPPQKPDGTGGRTGEVSAEVSTVSREKVFTVVLEVSTRFGFL